MLYSTKYCQDLLKFDEVIMVALCYRADHYIFAL